MSCELYDDVLDEYVDGARAADNADPTDTRLAAFESHLACCARCQGLVADFATIRRTAAALDEHLPPPRVWAKIASSIEQDERQPWWVRSLANTLAARVPLAAAASGASARGAGLYCSNRAAAAASAEQIGDTAHDGEANLRGSDRGRANRRRAGCGSRSERGRC